MNLKKRLVPIYELLATLLSTKKIELSKTKNNAIMFLTPSYGNIGDLAIGHAQQRFLEDNLKGYNVVSIIVPDTYKYLRHIKKTLKPDDIIFLVGGGSFGDLYPKADFGRIFIVNYFQKNKICFFPQTMVFRDTEYGRKRLAETQKAFGNNGNLTLVARETISYKLMKKTFNNETILSPDIVFYLLSDFQRKKDLQRDGVVFTLRADDEKFVSKEKEDQIIDYVKKNYSNFIFKDTTVSSELFNLSKKDEYIQDMLNTYRRSKLVITDRLHGMIFAVITGTPCIVLPNSNHKIKGTYNDWLTSCNYITLLDGTDLSNIEEIIARYASPDFKTNYSDLEIDFTNLKKYLSNNLKG